MADFLNLMLAMTKLAMACSDSDIANYVKIDRPKEFDVTEPLDKLLNEDKPNYSIIEYMVKNNILVPTAKSVILCIMKGDGQPTDPLFELIFGKYIKNFITENKINVDIPFLNVFTSLNTMVQNDLIEILIYAAYYGESSLVCYLLDQFNLKTAEPIAKSILLELPFMYAIRADNEDVIRCMLHYCPSARLYNRGACVAISNGKMCNGLAKSLIHLYYEERKMIDNDVMDMCVYVKNMDLLAELYTKYNEPVSEKMVEYCMKEKMNEYIEYFVFKMDLKMKNNVLEYCLENGMIDVAFYLVDKQKIYSTSGLAKFLLLYRHEKEIRNRFIAIIPQKILTEEILPLIVTKNNELVETIITDCNLRPNVEFLNNLCLQCNDDDIIKKYIIKHNIVPNDETFNNTIETDNTNLVAYLIGMSQTKPKIDIEKLIRYGSINLIKFVLPFLTDVKMNDELMQIIIDSTRNYGFPYIKTKYLVEIKEIVSLIEDSYGKKFSDAGIRFSRLVFELDRVDSEVYKFILDTLKVDNETLLNELGTIVLIYNDIEKIKYVIEKVLTNENKKVIERMLEYTIDNIAKDGNIKKMEYLINDLKLSHNPVKVSTGILHYLDDNLKKIKKNKGNLNEYLDFVHEHIEESKEYLKRKFNEINE